MATPPNTSAGNFVTGSARAEPKSARLVRAIEEGDAARVRLLLGDGASPNSRAPRRVGEIHGGAIRYKGGRVGLVFEHGSTTHSGLLDITALQAAAGGGHQEIVEMLINAGASINAPASDTLGRTALQAAAEGGHNEIVRILLAARAEVNSPASGVIGRTALQAASGAGDGEIVRVLLERGADVNAPASDYVGRTALQAAAEGGHQEIVQVLLESRADVNAPASEYRGRTALQVAAEGGHREIVQELLRSAADVNEPASGTNGRTALQAAAGGGHEEIVQELLRVGADVNVPASWRSGRTALQAAAGGGHGEIVQALLRENADVDAPASEINGRTALQAAAEGGHEEIVQALLRRPASADANAPASPESGRTALQAAAEGGHEEIVQALLRAGADVNALVLVPNGRTALQAAAEGGHEETVQALLRAGADANSPASPDSGRTALQAAAEGGHEEIVQALLLRAGADMNVPASWRSGRTALQAAAGGGHQEIAQALLDAGAEINAPASEYNGRTALQAAAEGGHEETVQALLGAGADANAPASPESGRTALQAAAEGGHEEVVQALLRAGADVNAQALTYGERTALQTAAEGGHEEIVQALLMAGADANAPASVKGITALHAAVKGGHRVIVQMLLTARAKFDAPAEGYPGRTALQVAAEGGFTEIVQVLLGAGSDANAPASEQEGRTALQAAGEGGHREIVQVLLKAGADPNAPASEYKGRTALHAAVECGHKEIVQALLGAGADANALASGYKGITALQAAAERGHTEIVQALLRVGADVNYSGKKTIFALAATIDLVKLLIKDGKASKDLRNDAGETALHEAARDGRVSWLESLLDLEFFDMNARNPRGETALHIALRLDSPNAVYTPLLLKGASTEGLVVGMLHKKTDRMSAVVLKDSTTNGGKSVELEWREPLSEYELPYSEPRSIWLLHSKPQNYHHNTGFFLPRKYIRRIAPSPENNEANAVVEFHWMRGGKNKSWSEVAPGAPIPTGGGSKAWLSGYVCFKYPPCLGRSAATDRRITGISWVMNNSSPGSSQLGKHFRSVHFRGSTADLSIPAHAIGFLTQLLRDVRKNWGQLFSDSESVLDQRNRDILMEEGKSALIGTLLEDGQRWADFRFCLRDHVSESRKLQKRFETDPAFYHEVLSQQGQGQAKQSAQLEDDQEGKQAILQLKNQIDALEEECNKKISELETRTNNMVDLEFSLVSINEARKSIDMSHSMKRLSWVTFIFLPLMFAATLFGMNVDALVPHPSLSWYPVFSIPLLALTFGVWLAFKNIGYLNSKLGNLKLKLGRYKRPRANNDSEGSEANSTRGSSSFSAPKQIYTTSTWASWLRRRGTHQPDEESSVSGSERFP